MQNRHKEIFSGDIVQLIYTDSLFISRISLYRQKVIKTLPQYFVHT